MKADPLSIFQAVLAPERITPREAAQERYGLDTWPGDCDLLGALRPGDASEVARIAACAAEHKVPLYPISTGRNWGYGTARPPQPGCAILDLSDLRAIDDSLIDLGVAVVEPGVTQQMLSDFLDAGGHGYMVPVTGGGPDCSLVGNALERGFGITPYCDHFAAVMGLEAVLASGETYSAAFDELGGVDANRLFKWGVGPYIDGLFTQGNFAVVTRVAIALAPRPERTEAFIFRARNDAELADIVAAIRTVSAKLEGISGQINLMNGRRILSISQEQLDAAYHHRRIPDEEARTMIRAHGAAEWNGVGALYGTSAVVKAAKRTVKAELKPVAGRLNFFTPGLASSLADGSEVLPSILKLPAIRTLPRLKEALRIIDGRPSRMALKLPYWKRPEPTPEEGPADPAADGCGLAWYAPVIPMRGSDVERFVELAEAACRKWDMEPLITLTTLSPRCFGATLPLLFDPNAPEQFRNAQACHDELTEQGRRQGFVAYRMASWHMDAFSEASGAAKFIAKLKQALDPDGIIAPGRYAKPPRPGNEPTSSQG